MLDVLKKMVAELSPEQRMTLARLLLPEKEPVAIIGMGCRFPGGANSPEAYWDLLQSGKDAIIPVPSDRWEQDAWYDPDPATPGKMTSFLGGFLQENIAEFDPVAFGITPREAASMDPQQRLLLEVSWEALDAAGIAREHLAGSKTGVFIAIYHRDYFTLQMSALDELDNFSIAGTAHSIAANRISYLLDLRGPSMAIDTACSSSLVALHLACQSLRTGESDLALAGGVSVMLTPDVTVGLSQMHVLAPDGRCKPFDARADGFVRGEGCGVLLLKRLSDAIRDHDPILALIRGSSLNQDGRSAGLTAPNSLSQQQVIAQALAHASLSPAQISYVETHGTGTSLGDPIEIEALAQALGTVGPPCLLGAVKSNIGHLEAAAGIAGCIKVILSMQHELIPANLHFERCNEHIHLQGTRLQIAQEATPWKRGDTPRFAGVSSFGFGGTNAHVVLEEAPVVRGMTPASSMEHYVLPISARTTAALRAAVAQYKEQIASWCKNDHSLYSICYTAGTRRSHYERRAAFVASTWEELAEQLAAFSQPPEAERHSRESSRGIVYVFSGQGAQWPGMGHELYTTEAVFRDTFQECDTIFRRYSGWSLIDTLMASPDSSRLDDTSIAQPMIFAIQVSLAALWRSWGIIPSAVVGHSIGEVAAAHQAGILDLETALQLVFYRGRIMHAVAGKGKMLSANIPLSQAEALLDRYKGRLSLAALNAPSMVTLAGDTALLEKIEQEMREKQIFARMMPVNYAFHSYQIAPLGDELQAALLQLHPQSARLPFFSTVFGRKIEPTEKLDEVYWKRNMCEPVLFQHAIMELHKAGYRTFLEVGAHPVLAPALRECVQEQGLILPSLRRGQPERRLLLQSLSTLYSCGYQPNWKALYQQPCLPVALPSYPWQRSYYWLPSGKKPAASAQPPLQKWLYEVCWQPYSVPSTPGKQQDWVLFTDSSGVGETVKHLLQASGQRCITVASTAHADADYVLESAEPSAYREILSAIMQQLTTRSLNILHLWSLDHSGEPPHFQHAQHSGCESVLLLVQALAHLELEHDTALWLVTKATQALDTRYFTPGLMQAPLWGLGRTLRHEFPSLRCMLVDLDLQPEQSALQTLTALLTEEQLTEDEFVLREQECYVSRLRPYSEMQRVSLSIKEQSAYLVAGGLGGLGLVIADWLVQQGARHLILVGRHAPGDDAQAVVQKLRKAGAEPLVLQADITNADDVRSILTTLEQKKLDLKGVIHAAAQLDDAIAVHTTPARLWKVMAPKIQGAWNLHLNTTQYALDFFILFSSVASLLGSAGQGSYAAANAFLDAFAHYRRAQGLPAIVINWGPWDTVGQVTKRENLETQLAERGLKSLKPAQGCAIISYLLGQAHTQVAAMHLDIPRFQTFYAYLSRSSLLADILPQKKTEADQSVRSQILALDASQQVQAIERELSSIIMAKTKLSSDDVTPQRTLLDLGLDSLTALDIQHTVQERLGVRVPLVSWLNNTGIGTLAIQIQQRLLEETATADTTAQQALSSPEQIDELLANIDSLSVEEMDAALNSLLQQKKGESYE
ncbi:type I polyketide synthase [Thermosporothrix hazakensis]|nr:type I polyketide synthase [Thermosporothrix hazakensis]GCE51338.1 hypothetical protein KTH_62070 [Thermosporothrix hazakensis]